MRAAVLIIGGLGYIGSRLSSHLLENGHALKSVDLAWFGDIKAIPNLRAEYSQLDPSFLQSFSAIVFLAGHTSVSTCEEDPEGSLRNNVSNFIQLTGRLNAEQKFIYASSASVYGVASAGAAREADRLEPALKQYDMHKQTIDSHLSKSNLNYYGLRLGTVCGYSPVPRDDLIINSMVKSALNDKRVFIANPDARRAVLGLSDLCRAIERLVTSEVRAPGLYNLASFNMTVGEIGRRVARYFHVSTEYGQSTNHYSFAVDTGRFAEAFSFSFADTVESICGECCRNDYNALLRAEPGHKYIELPDSH